MSRFGQSDGVIGMDLTDLDLDGHPDLVIAGNYWRVHGLRVLRNTSSPLFATPRFYNTSSITARGFDIADLDNDGKWDIVAAGGHGIVAMHNTSVFDGPLLDHSPLLRGQRATFVVRRARPGETVTFCVSPEGAGNSLGIGQLGGIILDLADPIIVAGSAIADAQGEARLQIAIPPNAPLLTISSQAVIRRGANEGESVKTPFRTARIAD